MILPDKRNRILSRLTAFFTRYLIVLVVVAVLASGVIATIRIIRGDAADGGQGGELPAHQEELRDSEVIRLAMYEPRSYNVLASSDEDVVYLNHLIYSSLFDLDDGMNVVPDAAASYTCDAASGRVDIKLREDVLFSDGSRLDADDVRYTVYSIKAIGEGSPYYSYASKIASVDELSDHELSIQFAGASDAALDNLVFPLISSDSYSASDSFCVGSGPYMYSDHKQGKSLSLLPNPSYYGGAPANRVEMLFVTDKSAVRGFMTMNMVTAFLSRERDARQAADDKGLSYIAVNSGELVYMGFNHKDGILADDSVRRAISEAIDKEKIAEDDYGGAAETSHTLYPEGFLGSEHAAEAPLYDPKALTEALKAHDISDINGDGRLEASDGAVYTLRLLVNSDDEQRVDCAETIRSELAKAGVALDVRSLPRADYTAGLSAGDFDIYLAGMKFDKRFDMRSLFGTYNYGGFADADLTKAVADMELAQSADELALAYERLDAMLQAKMPYVAICYKDLYLLTGSHFSTKMQPQYFDPYRGLAAWKWQVPVDKTASEEKVE